VTETQAPGQAPATRAWVLHPDITSAPRARSAGAALDEAVALAAAMPGLRMAGHEIVKLRSAQPGMLFGTGKVEELATRLKAEDIELVLIDGPVSPVQQRNLEKAWKVKILDRTGLILEIFSDRARTREGVLQVEMAALSYQRTRLVRAWTHLERQRGGLGFVGGPGETQIEADRRAIDEQLTRLKRQLAKVVKTRALHRSARAKVPYPIVALVGYTNAGKSSLFNRLTGEAVLAEDMLFATLDPTMRAVELPTGKDVILSDTVGFISDLPTQLVAAFRATLEEVLEADLILHVRDIADPETEAQAADVAAIMDELGVDETTPQLEVWNKVDLVAAEARAPLEVLANRRAEVFVTSAVTGEGMDPLLQAVTEALAGATRDEALTLAFAEGRARAWLHDQGVVRAETQTEDGFHLQLCWTEKQRAQFGKLRAGR
jgi:GTP-binding protein HflX